MPTYPGISSEAFKHPLDQQAEQALRAVPGFDLVAENFSEYLYERPQQIFLMGNNIKVGPGQYPTLYGIYRECLRDLAVDTEPTLFVSQDLSVNVYSLGRDMPYIVLNTDLLDLLEEDELRTVIAHELGHLKCGHTILIAMALWVTGVASLLGKLTLGLGQLIATGLIYAFYEWRRKAELSADRAALLVMGDLDPIIRTMMKMSGGSEKYAYEMTVEEFIRQSQEYQKLDQNGLNQIYKFLIYNEEKEAFLTHPFAVERLHYLQQWIESEQYRQILQGNYPREKQQDPLKVNANRG